MFEDTFNTVPSGLNAKFSHHTTFITTIHSIRMHILQRQNVEIVSKKPRLFMNFP